MATAQDFANQENRSAYIQAGWATGNYNEYHQWQSEHSIDKKLAESILELYGVDQAEVRGHEADYGGGSECARFYEIPGAIIGITTTGFAWFCLETESIPDVTDYEEQNND